MKVFYDLNFFVKLAAAFLVMLAAWLVPGWKYGLPLALLTVAFLVLVKVPGLRGYLKGAVLLTLLVMASWILNLVLQGMAFVDTLPIAAGMAARLVTTTAAFYFVMETSTPGSILAAASAARLPPMVTLVLSLTFGIIPMLREDFERIADAQRARGMEIDDVSFPMRLRFALARGVPLLVQAIRMAHAISLSLAIYGFDTKRKRTTWRNVGLLVESRLNSKDVKR
ncbi:MULTISPECIES: energy-coupling factor transporter transmembrane component T family protein [Ochrobactrum]|jgi:energy-coupling factor transport system permease protein|uniref:Energy-coupling factor transporter transmembrane protein EcfT n=1 Tax=Ochrobactrum quorumnocens TaxID=271865 RepID=A0A5N1K399_9HYPH|nr:MULTISPECIES: energy-coupling factor transporter transmembrane component T [Brucella/Ochrobactrum group]KAA9370069.1 energy-coupling factor transporter transmembrane protein EcfT [[Ochrobactrum] quorumnocens]MBD7989499.1 energy-coupling factor transporter transmembrane protein EcfT [Ochrobactrum gallinarum]MCV9907001.1 energy-coupling factor transporter transmembrane protein EcfT [Brucella sp. HL-2]MDH7793012.1 energy-coupling factor transport system permease protein [Ochrobactrum sp. AN78]